MVKLPNQFRHFNYFNQKKQCLIQLFWSICSTIIRILYVFVLVISGHFDISKPIHRVFRQRSMSILKKVGSCGMYVFFHDGPATSPLFRYGFQTCGLVLFCAHGTETSSVNTKSETLFGWSFSNSFRYVLGGVTWDHPTWLRYLTAVGVHVKCRRCKSWKRSKMVEVIWNLKINSQMSVVNLVATASARSKPCFCLFCSRFGCDLFIFVYHLCNVTVKVFKFKVDVFPPKNYATFNSPLVWCRR